MTDCPFSFATRLKRTMVCCAFLAGLAACGSGNSGVTYQAAPLAAESLENAPRFAQGPIGTACRIHGQRGATSSTCGCIQAAANLTLSSEQQQRAVRFFAEPELLQQIKLSDTPTNERFWDTWARFAETAEVMCS